MALNVKTKFEVDTAKARAGINEIIADFGKFGKVTEQQKNKIDLLAHSLQAFHIAGQQLSKISGLATTFTRTADEIANLNSRLKLASASTAEYISQQKALLNIANSSYSKLSDTTDLYIKMAQGLKPLGYELKEINAVTASFSKALQLGGASA